MHTFPVLSLPAGVGSQTIIARNENEEAMALPPKLLSDLTGPVSLVVVVAA